MKTKTNSTTAKSGEEKYYPVWLSDNEIDVGWMDGNVVLGNSALGRLVSRDGATLKLALEFDNGTENKRLVAKQVPEGGSKELSKRLGLAREALFYDNFAFEFRCRDGMHDILPKVYYSYGDYETGEKFVLMEDLSDRAVDSAIFFGPGNPNNWNRDLPKEVESACFGGVAAPTPEQVAMETFTAIAKIHGIFWRRRDLFLTDCCGGTQQQWLRGQQWVQRKDRESWEASQGLIRDIWSGLHGKVDEVLDWDPLLKSIVDKAVHGISWDAQMERLDECKTPWTLVHGDFWPGNVLWMINQDPNVASSSSKIKIIDWEMCGIGSGPQDLGQYILSNMEPDVRREHERDLVRAYYDELLRNVRENDRESITWDYVWDEYRIGGLERWLWFLVYFLGQGLKFRPWAQFFHDQMASFVNDHGLTPADVTQVRP